MMLISCGVVSFTIKLLSPRIALYISIQDWLIPMGDIHFKISFKPRPEPATYVLNQLWGIESIRSPKSGKYTRKTIIPEIPVNAFPVSITARMHME